MNIRRIRMFIKVYKSFYYRKRSNPKKKIKPLYIYIYYITYPELSSVFSEVPLLLLVKMILNRTLNSFFHIQVETVSLFSSVPIMPATNLSSSISRSSSFLILISVSASAAIKSTQYCTAICKASSLSS